MADPAQAKYSESKEVTAFRREAVKIYIGKAETVTSKILGVCDLIKKIRPEDKEAEQKKLIANLILQRLLGDMAREGAGKPADTLSAVFYTLTYVARIEEKGGKAFRETRAMLAAEIDGAVRKFATGNAFVAKESGTVRRAMVAIEKAAGRAGYGEILEACKKARLALPRVQDNISEFLQQPQDNLKTEKMDERGKTAEEYIKRMKIARDGLSCPKWTEYVEPEKVRNAIGWTENLWLNDGQLRDILGGKTVALGRLKIKYEKRHLSAYVDFGKDLQGIAEAIAENKYSTVKINLGAGKGNPNGAQAPAQFFSFAETDIHLAADAIKAIYSDFQGNDIAKRMIAENYDDIVKFYALAKEANWDGSAPDFRWLHSIAYHNSKDGVMPKAEALGRMNKALEMPGVDRRAVVEIERRTFSLLSENPDFLYKLATRCGSRLGSALMPGINLDKRANDKAFNALLDRFKGDAPLMVALYHCEGVVAQRTLDGKAGEIQKRIGVLKEFGVEYVERLDPVILENFYKTATGKADKVDANGKPKKLALIALNKDDWNDAFRYSQEIYHSLAKEGYGLLFCEENWDTRIAERLFNHGRLQYQKNANSPKGQKNARYDLLILGGHGQPSSIDFGNLDGEPAELDLGDYAKLKKYGDWEGMFTDRAAVLLWSCSTGGKLENGDKGDFSNMMTMLSHLTVRVTFAPRKPTNVEEIEFDNDGYVVGVRYYDKGAENSVRPIKPGAKK